MSKVMNEFLQRICDKYQAVNTGTEWLCRCPAHDDTTPSLSVREIENKVLWHCFAGCTQQDILDAFRRDGLTGGSNDEKAYRIHLPNGIPHVYPPASILTASGRVPGPDTQKLFKALYPYIDENGAILGYVVRYQRGDKKQTIPFFKTTNWGAWRSGHATHDHRPLYIPIPIKQVSEVWVVEGEKCTDYFNRAWGTSDRIAISWPGGCKSVSKANWGPLTNKLVTVWCDFDAPGVLAGRALATVLRPIAKLVRFVDIYSLGFTEEGSDCVDYAGADLPTEFSPIPPVWKPRPVGRPPQQVPLENEAPATEGKVNLNTPAKTTGFQFPLTEFGNTDRFMARFGEDFKISNEAGWHAWTGKNWERDTENKLKLAIKKTVADIPAEIKQNTDVRSAQALIRWSHTSSKNSAVNAVAALATSVPELQISLNDFDKNIYLLNCLNGTVDLKTGTLYPHRRENLCSHLANANYVPGARCDCWKTFLDYAFKGDLAVIDYFHKAVGYCVTGDTSEQVFFATEGPGSTGKGVAFELLAFILGTYAQAVKAEMFLLSSKGDSATGDNSVAAIRGARLCLSSEINPGARLNEARVKELTGQDTIQARFLYQEFFSFTPVAKFWLRCNGLPNIAGGDSGIWRRIRLLPFKRVVEEDRYDPYLRDKLKLEADGILTWAVEGARKWLEKRLSPPQSCVSEAMRYREDMDLVGLWLSDRCVFDKDSKTMSTSLYVSYLDWCDMQGEKPHSQRWLSFEIRQRGLTRIRLSNGSAYEGIRLKNSGMATEREIPLFDG